MNERYRKAAKWAQKHVATLAILIRGDRDAAYYGHAKEEHEAMMLLEQIASKLATGDWVLCEGESAGFTIRSDLSGDMIANIADWETPEYTPLYIAIPELP